METGKIVHIDSHGRVQIAVGDRMLYGQIMVGGGQRGDAVSGPMEAGLRTLLHCERRIMVVQIDVVEDLSVPEIDACT